MSESFDKSLRQIEESRLLHTKMNNTQNMSQIERFYPLKDGGKSRKDTDMRGGCNEMSFNILAIYVVS